MKREKKLKNQFESTNERQKKVIRLIVEKNQKPSNEMTIVRYSNG